MGKRHKPVEIIGKLREAEIVFAQGSTTGAVEPAATPGNLGRDVRQADLTVGRTSKLLGSANKLVDAIYGS